MSRTRAGRGIPTLNWFARIEAPLKTSCARHALGAPTPPQGLEGVRHAQLGAKCRDFNDCPCWASRGCVRPDAGVAETLQSGAVERGQEPASCAANALLGTRRNAAVMRRRGAALCRVVDDLAAASDGAGGQGVPPRIRP